MFSRTLLMLISLVFGFSAATATYYLWFFWLQNSGENLFSDYNKLLYLIGEGLLEGIKYSLSVGVGKVIAPALILALLGVLLRIRSFFYYIPAGGLAAIAVPVLVGQAEKWAFHLPNPAYTQIYLLAGIVGGFVYWLVGGANASNRPRRKKRQKKKADAGLV